MKLILLLLFLSACATITNYENPNEPVYLSNEAQPQGWLADFPDSLLVLSFNIRKSAEVDLAVSELQSFSKSHRIDILLLQEMDEAGTRKIASRLQFNYLYIPIAYNHLQKQDVGNAILSRGEIRLAKKLILPNKKGINGRRRHAAVAEVMMGGNRLLVYSVHTETSSMKREKRLEQFAAILDDAKASNAGYSAIVIGGDFNTLHAKDKRELLHSFSEAGFPCVSDTTGNTATAASGLVKPTLDFIFSKGLQTIAAGRIDSSKASDHLPVFSILRR